MNIKSRMKPVATVHSNMQGTLKAIQVAKFTDVGPSNDLVQKNKDVIKKIRGNVK